MPSSLGATSSWDVDSACEFGTVIGQELRAQGFNMTLGGGVDLAREPRNGRSFEYAGEDPLLAGTVVGNLMKCEQAQHVVGDIKHYVMNDQETGRFFVNAVISKRLDAKYKKTLFTERAGGEKVRSLLCPTPEVEASWVGREVRRLLREEGKRPRDIASATCSGCTSCWSSETT